MNIKIEDWKEWNKEEPPIDEYLLVTEVRDNEYYHDVILYEPGRGQERQFWQPLFSKKDVVSVIEAYVMARPDTDVSEYIGRFVDQFFKDNPKQDKP